MVRIKLVNYFLIMEYQFYFSLSEKWSLDFSQFCFENHITYHLNFFWTCFCSLQFFHSHNLFRVMPKAEILLNHINWKATCFDYCYSMDLKYCLGAKMDSSYHYNLRQDPFRFLYFEKGYYPHEFFFFSFWL